MSSGPRGSAGSIAPSRSVNPSERRRAVNAMLDSQSPSNCTPTRVIASSPGRVRRACPDPDPGRAWPVAASDIARRRGGRGAARPARRAVRAAPFRPARGQLSPAARASPRRCGRDGRPGSSPRSFASSWLTSARPARRRARPLADAYGQRHAISHLRSGVKALPPTRCCSIRAGWGPSSKRWASGRSSPTMPDTCATPRRACRRRDARPDRPSHRPPSPPACAAAHQAR